MDLLGWFFVWLICLVVSIYGVAHTTHADPKRLYVAILSMLLLIVSSSGLFYTVIAIVTGFGVWSIT